MPHLLFYDVTFFFVQYLFLEDKLHLDFHWISRACETMLLKGELTTFRRENYQMAIVSGKLRWKSTVFHPLNAQKTRAHCYVAGAYAIDPVLAKLIALLASERRIHTGAPPRRIRRLGQMGHQRVAWKLRTVITSSLLLWLLAGGSTRVMP